MSKTDSQVKVEEVQDDDAPELVDDIEAGKIDDDAVARAAGQLGKTSKRYAKAMAKLGLKPEPNIFRIAISKGRAQNLAISKPEVYRFPGTNTFVIFGEIQGDDNFGGGAAQDEIAKAAAAVTSGADNKKASATAAAKNNNTSAAADADDDNVDAGDLGEKEIKLVMAQANVSRGKAIKALKNNNGDIVNTIMELTM